MTIQTPTLRYTVLYTAVMRSQNACRTRDYRL